MAKISIIIPVFNKEKFICRSIDSILNQTFDDYDIIIVNDGSTDNSVRKILKYKDKRIKIINQKNMGPGFARNIGIQESNSKYITFLDADDEWMPSFLDEYYLKLSSNPECDYIVGTHFQGINKVTNLNIWEKLQLKEGIWECPDKINYNLFHQYLTQLHTIGAMICKKNILIKYKGFYSKYKYKYGEDRYLEIQLLINHKLYLFLKPLLWYHKETQGISTILDRKKPLVPIIMDPQQIINNCPYRFKNLIEKYIGSIALSYAENYMNLKDFKFARQIINTVPMVKKLPKKYLKVQFKSILQYFE